jgi:amino acid transporter
MFAFIGFRHAIDMAGETRRPQVTIPVALILAIIICAAVYLLLQVAFIGSLDEADLAHAWSSFDFGHRYGPLGALAQALGMIWLVQVIVGSAIIGPFGAALVSTGSNGRLVLALARNGFFAAMFTKLSRYGVPLPALILNTVVGIVVLLLMPFDEIVAINSSSLTLALTTGPLALLALRRLAPDEPRWFRLPWAPFLAGLAFVIATLVIYWSGWDTLWRLGIALIIGLVVFAYRNRHTDPNSLDLLGALWLVPYLAVIGVVSALGDFGGGSGVIPFGWDIAILTAMAIVLLVIAVRGRISRERFLERRERARQDMARASQQGE